MADVGDMPGDDGCSQGHRPGLAVCTQRRCPGSRLVPVGRASEWDARRILRTLPVKQNEVKELTLLGASDSQSSRLSQNKP